MSRYINFDFLLDKVNDNPCTNGNARVAQLLGVIMNIPEAEVIEVKHGEWIDIPLNSDPNDFAHKYNLRTKCSVCDYVMPREYPRFKICPCCGAKMDGDKQ